MNKKHSLYAFSALIVLFIILGITGFFYHKNIVETIHETYLQEQQQNIQDNTRSRNYFEDTFSLGNYQNSKYTLEPGAHNIIKNIREKHLSPTLVTKASRNKEVCAGFIWLLSEELWGKNLPYYIGMLHQPTRMPAAAWELPNAYAYFGGKVLINFSSQFNPAKKDLWEKISTKDIELFFVYAFSEKALFGDIGFLYDSTKYVSEILKTGNYNSHITKNMGISKFSKTLKHTKDLSHREIIQENLSCRKNILEKLYPALNYYKFQLNGKNIILDGEDFYYIKDNMRQKKVVFQYLDTLSYNDITLAHFFNKQAHVDSLIEMTCKGKFLPVNIIAINPALIEKK